MYLSINVVMKQQRYGAINKSLWAYTSGQQACPHSNLPAVLLACRPSCHPACRLARLLTCRHAGRQPSQQAAPLIGRLKYNELKLVLQLIFTSKMSNRYIIMRRNPIFSIFQRNNFGNKG